MRHQFLIGPWSKAVRKKTIARHTLCGSGGITAQGELLVGGPLSE